MSYNLSLAMTCCDRLDYTRRTLESLQKCHGVKDIKLDIFCEPGSDSLPLSKWTKLSNAQSVIDYVKSLNFCDINVHINSERFRHTRNSHCALNYCFDNYKDYTVLIEDDQLYSYDFLRIHDYFKEKYRDDSSIFTASLGHYISPKRIREEKELYTYTKHKHFSNQGWGTWLDRWNDIRDRWEEYETVTDHTYKNNYKHGGWDWKMSNVLRGDRSQVVSYIPRVYNFGQYGIHCKGDVWQTKVKLESWGGDFNIDLDQPLRYKNICIEDGMSPVPESHEKWKHYV